MTSVILRCCAYCRGSLIHYRGLPDTYCCTNPNCIHFSEDQTVLPRDYGEIAIQGADTTYYVSMMGIVRSIEVTHEKVLKYFQQEPFELISRIEAVSGDCFCHKNKPGIVFLVAQNTLVVYHRHWSTSEVL